MAELTLDGGRTALLMADFHAASMGGSPLVKELKTVEKSRAVLDMARRTGLQVIHIVVNFRQGYPEISGRNKNFRGRMTSGQVPAGDPVSLIIPDVAPQPGEPVVVKHRVSAFFGTDLDMILRAHGIDTLLIMGFATSGVVLSTLRYAADADYQLVVVEDCCADHSAEVHAMLMEKIFPSQATVVSSEDVLAALSRE